MKGLDGTFKKKKENRENGPKSPKIAKRPTFFPGD